MDKDVLGNDPFLRGAALRPPAKAKPAPSVTPHSASPELVAVLDEHGTTPHAASPVLMKVVSAPPSLVKPPPAGGLELFFAAASGLLQALRTGLGARGSRALDAYGQDPALTRAVKPLADLLYDRYWRVSVTGAEQVPAGPVILVANHSGALPLDGPVVHHALARERPGLKETRWLVEDQIFCAPFVGTLTQRLGALRASPENALKLLADGRPVLVFPEGVQGTGKAFRDRYRLARFGRGGFAKLAVQAQVPIVPVAVVGAEESTPLLAKLPGRLFGLSYLPLTTLPLPTRWEIQFGGPIRIEREHVQEAADGVRTTIQTMLDEMLTRRKSIF